MTPEITDESTGGTVRGNTGSSARRVDVAGAGGRERGCRRKSEYCPKDHFGYLWVVGLSNGRGFRTLNRRPPRQESYDAGFELATIFTISHCFIYTRDRSFPQWSPALEAVNVAKPLSTFSRPEATFVVASVVEMRPHDVHRAEYLACIQVGGVLVDSKFMIFSCKACRGVAGSS